MSFRALIVSLLMITVLSGCGGGSSGSSSNNQPTSNVGSLNTGFWQDLHPENLTYTTNSVSGVTDSNGKFNYKCPIQGCEGVTFSLGGIIIGSSIGQSGLNLASLNGGMSNGLLSPTTISRAQFLYAFDSDANPTNGITLPIRLADTLKYSGLDFTSNNFAAALQHLITQAQQDSALDLNYRNNLIIPSVADARALVEQANIALNGVFVESPTLPGVNVSTVHQYIVNFPSNFTVNYSGSSNSVTQLANGVLHPSLGAGLTFVSGSTQGTVTLQAVTSRGIAVNAPNYYDGSSIAPATVLLSSAAAPAMATLSLSTSGLAVTGVTPLLTQQGSAYSGLPLPPGSSGSFGERNLNEALSPVTPQEFDVDGLDPAGITSANDGSFWICDRRGPFLIQVDAAGHTRLRLGPQGSLGNLPYVTRLLPTILESRQRDLGCGGITRRPASNDIIMAVGAALNPGGNSALNAIFTRLVSYNPTNQAIHQYAVALQAGDHNLQVLDMAALGDSSFLLLVHYIDAQNADQWEIRKISIANATDVQNLLLTNGPNANRDLEYGTLAEITASNVTLVVPTTVLSLNAIGWTRSSLQSMALIDNYTIALMTNSDGGVTSAVTGGSNGSDPTQYQVDSHGVISPRANLSTPAQWSPVANKFPDRQTLFWLISLTNPLTP